MAKMKITGLEDFQNTLRALGDQAERVMKAAVYAGADVMVQTVKEEIQALPVQNGYMPPGVLRNEVSDQEKAALLSHIGIAKMDFDGGRVSTAIGFDGYTDYTTRKYQKGVPVAMLARSIESGSSVRRKNPFLRRAGKKAKERAQAAMVQAANAEIEKMKG